MIIKNKILSEIVKRKTNPDELHIFIRYDVYNNLLGESLLPEGNKFFGVPITCTNNITEDFIVEKGEDVYYRYNQIISDIDKSIRSIKNGKNFVVFNVADLEVGKIHDYLQVHDKNKFAIFNQNFEKLQKVSATRTLNT